MFNFKRSAPQIPLVFASLVLWVSFAWGLPAEASVTEGEAEVAAEDPWAGVRISDAYDYAKCSRCGHKNEVRRPACYRCGYSLPQPSGEYTYPPWVFVPGKGYYREGTVVEPAGTRKGYWITGIIITGALVATGMLLGMAEYSDGGIALGLAYYGAMGVGVGLIIYGLVARTEPVYAFTTDERFNPYKRPAFALRSPDPDGVRLKVELTALAF
jgi:hypothetical protein